MSVTVLRILVQSGGAKKTDPGENAETISIIQIVSNDEGLRHEGSMDDR